MTLFSQNGSNGHTLAGFWRLSRRFWLAGKPSVTGLIVLMISVVLLQLLVQFYLNLWNRHFFDALERRDAGELWTQTSVFLVLASASIVLTATSVWARMTCHRKWRESMTRAILEIWSRKRHDVSMNGQDHGAENPEYRLAEDVRVATDAPVDLILAFLSSVLTALTFFSVLWSVGGSIVVSPFGHRIEIPGYLVLGVMGYSTLMTALMLWFGRRMTSISEQRNQNEAEFRAAAEVLRGGYPGSEADVASWMDQLHLRLQAVLRSWRNLCWQLVDMTLVSHANFLFAPVAAYFLCFPKYLSGAMSLGEVTQSAAAFVTVQGAVNWLVDNYQRLADWRSSANRVAALLSTIDRMPEQGEAAANSESREVAPH
ncbi:MULTISPECIES: SbmA/BacA-like family transporter [Rhodopseudomonas]|uniref:ABC transporter-like n=2 Tax=Rhodopseudomonas TaxID=1073 RepID=Q13A14_RHOPS|nr:ABC transporter-like [Rhodopseudomonas palustris BisB5]SEO70069.1 ABC transporter transmembrane region 2 [Rhodopseudomonas pseudopalustris]